MSFWSALAIAYLTGAIPASYLAARFGAGIDLREHGSKNLGATNLYRVLGFKYAIPVGLFDLLKGTAPVLALPPRITGGVLAGGDPWAPIMIGAAAVLGHVYPVYLRFKGGKGVATAAGVMVGVAPFPFLASAVTWAGVLFGTRIMSLASVSGAVVFPVAARLMMPEVPSAFWIGLLMAGFILFTHRTNLRRLVSGTEPKLWKKDPPEPGA